MRSLWGLFEAYEKGNYANIPPPFPSWSMCSRQESIAHLLSRMRSVWAPAVDLLLPQQQTREGQSWCLLLSKSGSNIAKSDGRRSLFGIAGRVRANVRYWEFQFDSLSFPVNVFINYEVKVLCVFVFLARLQQRKFLNRCLVNCNFLTLYASCIISQYVYEPTGSTFFCD